MDIKKQYTKDMTKILQEALSIKNPMAVPSITKIVVNMGVRDAVSDKKNVEKMALVLGQITGQKAKVNRARKSIATFKLREGDPIGVMVTLRGQRMYEFFEKLVKVVIPRLRDFRGVSRTSFDGRGNYALGLSEYAVFPEIDPSSVEKMQGLEIIFTTTATDDESARVLLEKLGVPFQKEGTGRRA
jgi:large subunit ribosomal protein L5